MAQRVCQLGKYFQMSPEFYNSATTLATDCTMVRAFYNGLYCVVPNPQIPALVNDIMQHYNVGRFIEYKDICVPNKMFNDPKYWSS